MNDMHYTRITIRTTSNNYYTEQEVAEYSQMGVQMIRRLQRVGLIQGVEVANEERRYRDEDIERLRRIRRLHRDLGVNLAGIDIILRLSAQMQELQRELEQLRDTSKDNQE